MKPSPYSNDEYTIGWISALNDEFVVAMAMLDEEHGRPQSTPRDDTNAYHLGSIGDHKVTMACLSGGQSGTGPAAVVAENMRRTFKNIRFALLVGIGGGVPGGKKDVRLGDVVVSYPQGTYTGIVQYDYGKLESNGHIQRKDWFSAPPRKVLAAVDLLRAYHSRPKKPMNNMLEIIDELGEEYEYPDEDEYPDNLYQADYVHRTDAETCESCNAAAIVSRKARRVKYQPSVHYGVIASGNMVVKSAIERDKIAQRYENSTLCFEREAAGLMNNFPCLVIRGISDYCDSHKNDEWQKRAIAAASAYTKELLSIIEPSDVDVPPPIAARVLDTVSNEMAKIYQSTAENNKLQKQAAEETQRRQLQDLRIQCERWLKPPNTREIQQHQVKNRVPGTCDWIWSNPAFVTWNGGHLVSGPERIMCIYGPPWCGKSILASSMIEHMENSGLTALSFAYSSLHARQQRTNGLVRSLLWQILKISPEGESISILHELMLRGQPTTSDMWVAFKKIATLGKKTVYCILDGVDESLDAISDLFRQITDFLEACLNFRFVLLGRQHAFQGLDSLHHEIMITPALTSSDLDKVIESQVEKFELLREPMLRDEVYKSLRGKSDGNFLWIKLMLSHIGKSLGLADALKRLQSLPVDLEQAYEGLLSELASRLESEEQKLARKAFSFIIASQRPLHMDEFQHLLAAHAISTRKSDSDILAHYLIPQLSLRIYDLCGDLITVVNDRLQLVHFSVKEFLLRPQSQWLRSRRGRKIVNYRVSLDDAHRWYAEACIEYVERCEFTSMLQSPGSPPDIALQYPFLRYSSTNLITHASHSGKASGSIRKRIDRFLDSDQWIFRLEIYSMTVLEEESVESQDEEFQKFTTWFGVTQEELIRRILISLKASLEKGALQYGETDARTEKARLFFSLLESTASLAEAPASIAIHSVGRQAHIKPMLQMIRSSAPLSIQLQVDLLLRMQAHLKSARRLTDPLQILFRLILSKASSMSIYTLMAIAQFYNKFGKFDQALEVYSVALKKIKKEGRQKFLILELIGDVYMRLHCYSEALEKYQHALRGKEGLLGPNHNENLTSLARIGYANASLNRDDDALHYLDRALAGDRKFLKHQISAALWWTGLIYIRIDQPLNALRYFEESLATDIAAHGREHKSNPFKAGEIGLFLLKLDRHQDAIEYFERAFLGEETNSRSGNPKALDWLFHMGVSYYELNQCQNSLQSIERYLLGMEKNSEVKSGRLLTELWTMGLAYCELEQYENAFDQFQRYLSFAEKEHGIEDKRALAGLWKIAGIYDKFGQYANAPIQFKKHLSVTEKISGPEDPDSLIALWWIGITYGNLDQDSDALRCFEICLRSDEKELGREHKLTFLDFCAIGRSYQKLNQHEDALDYLQIALVGQERLLGLENEDTLNTAFMLGTTYEELDDNVNALECFTKCLAYYEKTLGPGHEDTFFLVYVIVKIFHKLERYQDAFGYLGKGLAGQEKLLGSEHDSTLDTLWLVGVIYDEHINRHEDALECFIKCFTVDHTTTLFEIFQIGKVYLKLNRYQDALEYLQMSLARHEQALGAEHEGTLSTLWLIGIACENLNEHQSALEYLERAHSGSEKAFGPEHELTRDIREEIDNLGTGCLERGQLSYTYRREESKKCGPKKQVGTRTDEKDSRIVKLSQQDIASNHELGSLTEMDHFDYSLEDIHATMFNSEEA